MRAAAACLALTLACSGSLAQDPPHPDRFAAGLYADDARAVTCVTGTAGAAFSQVLWAWAPPDLGLRYLTLRFAFPANLEHAGRPVFHDQVTDVIITDYVDGTVEWNLVFTDCPSGWIRVFVQECVLLDDQPARIGIHAADSMARDCTFALNDLDVLNELLLNDPGCPTVPAATVSWGGLAVRFR
jgi:hypothetical protein